MKKTDKIYLKFNNACIRDCCALTDVSFKPDIPLAFFLNNNYGLPVTPEIALERGFIMDESFFSELTKFVLIGMGQLAPDEEINIKSMGQIKEILADRRKRAEKEIETLNSGLEILEQTIQEIEKSELRF